MSVPKPAESTDAAKNVALRENESAFLAELDTDTLASIKTLDDVQALLSAHGIEATDASDQLGDGFALVDDKERLVGQPFVVLKWTEYEGDFGPFVALHIVTRDHVNGNNKFIIVDGSTGIKEQLAYYESKTGRTTGLVCRNGLRASDYMRCETHGTIHKKNDDARDDKCRETPGRTFYIDTSA